MKIKLMLAAAIACGMAPASLPVLAPQAAHAFSFNSCLDSDPELSSLVSSAKPPQSAGSIVHLTNLMFVIKETLSYAAANCQDESDYAQVRADYQASYDQARTACRQLANDQAICVPTRYVR